MTDPRLVPFLDLIADQWSRRRTDQEISDTILLDHEVDVPAYLIGRYRRANSMTGRRGRRLKLNPAEQARVRRQFHVDRMTYEAIGAYWGITGRTVCDYVWDREGQAIATRTKNRRTRYKVPMEIRPTLLLERKAGQSAQALAAKYECSTDTIWRIVRMAA